MSEISERVQRELKRLAESQSRVAPTGSGAMPREATTQERVTLPPDLQRVVKERLRGNENEDTMWRALWNAFGWKFKP